MKISPEDGVTIPQIVEINVVFPAPLGPSKARISPAEISKETSSSAVSSEL